MLGGRRRFDVMAVVLVIAFGSQLSAAWPNEPPLTTSQSGIWDISKDGTEAVLIAESGGGPAQLTVAFSEIKDADRQISIETDARRVLIRRGQHTIKLDSLSEQGSRILLVNDPEGPRVFVDEEKPPRWQGAWIRLLRDATTMEDIHVGLEGASFASVTIALTGKNRQTAAALNPAEIVDRVQSAIFELRVNRPDSTAVFVGTGFVVDSSGLALTNYHVVEGGEAASAYFRGVDDPIAVELYNVDHERDLAIVRVDLAALPASYRLSPLELASEAPRLGSDVLAFGFPEAISFSVARGVVSALVHPADFPGKHAWSVKDYPEDSLWVQTDAAINHGYSGGPLVDTDGRIVGINTWGLGFNRTIENMNFAIAAAHAKDLLDRTPQQIMTFAQARATIPAIPASRRFGFPRIKVNQTRKADDVRRIIASFKDNVVCSTCDARGKISKRVFKGWGVSNGFRTPMYENKRVQCPRCAGLRMDPDWRRIQRIGKSIVEQLARVRRDDPRYEQMLEFGRGVIANALALNPKRMEFSLNDTGARAASIQNTKLGEPVIIVAKLNVDERLSHDVRLRLVTMTGTGQQFFINDAVLVNATKAEVVIAGGLLAGFTTVDGKSVPVLQDGLIVGLRSPN